MESINKILSGIALPIVLVIYAIYFTIRLRGKPLTKIKSIFGTIFKTGKNTGVSPLRAVFFALAGTLGVGNIVGVASAIALGGAGSVFWMWISAAFAMVLKYCEVVLSILHRRSRNGEKYGGAMYYMKDCFDKRNKRGFGYVFSFLFVIFCLLNGLTMGCIIQTNSIAESFELSFGIPNIAVGIVLALITIIVLIFNGKKIFSLCEKLVPFVSLLYLVLSLAVIFKSFDRLPDVFLMILKDALAFESVGAGVLGFFLSRALRYGTIRGLFSNEAGCGTSPIAHATSNTSSPCEQGFLGIFEVFVDTIVVCTLTALVILLNWEVSLEFLNNPILMVFSAFGNSLGRWSYVALTVAIFLFALATIICWGYYSKECIYFINRGRRAERIFYWIFSCFVFVGSFIELDAVWQAADLAIGAMTVMNLFVLGLMNKEIASETEAYFNKK